MVFKGLRHGWEVVPFQNSNAERSSQALVPQMAEKTQAFQSQREEDLSLHPPEAR
jgi:hypothetical protein